MVQFHRLIVTALVIQFGVNVVWENLQLGIFEGYTPVWQGGTLCLLGPLGDTLFAGIAYGVLALWKRDWAWLARATGRDLLLVGLLGLAWGWASELVATNTGLWTYRPGVATLGGSAYGPLVELALTTPLAFALAQVIVRPPWSPPFRI
ncbi:hypothetical protein HY375_02435 [Candidatus Berkelbacteria bacterium]|nr:hypothetical protein [Candidatus Berkelbacteria bacterium]